MKWYRMMLSSGDARCHLPSGTSVTWMTSWAASFTTNFCRIEADLHALRIGGDVPVDRAGFARLGLGLGRGPQRVQRLGEVFLPLFAIEAASRLAIPARGSIDLREMACGSRSRGAARAAGTGRRTLAAARSAMRRVSMIRF
jgi:hypothetical protein